MHRLTNVQKFSEVGGIQDQEPLTPPLNQPVIS